MIDMQAIRPKKDKTRKKPLKMQFEDILDTEAITNSWARIAPFWPLKSLIAVNPIAGFEDLPFENALKEAHVYFQQKDLPGRMEEVNRETIKWVQSFFDEGQSTIRMPLRRKGLLKCVLTLIKYDNRLDLKDQKKREWLHSLSKEPKKLISDCLRFLEVPSQDHERFLTLILTTLPGWAAYVQYRTEWSDGNTARYPVTKEDYLSLRLVLTCLIWPEAKNLLHWNREAFNKVDVKNLVQKIESDETSYQSELLKKLKPQNKQKNGRSDADFVFCIDVRSEQFRRALESQGNYDTYGFAGFFGLPVSIKNSVTGESHSSCPVLLKPAHQVVENPVGSYQESAGGHLKLRRIKKLYQSVKYTFLTPFSLVETIGPLSGFWMALRSFFPKLSASLKSKAKKALYTEDTFTPNLETIPFEDQVTYGANALKMMGHTDNFAPLVVFCGHGSSSQNNAYASALDCGACGGHSGGSNARILAAILNSPDVRKELKKHHINLSSETTFIAAEHNTTTDEVILFEHGLTEAVQNQLTELKKNLRAARERNCYWRGKQLDEKVELKQSIRHTASRAEDWAQVRPEWGLSRNAAFVIGPRWLTKGADLEGRSFLHSYDWKSDSDGDFLGKILTAPMVVAQWINAQYFFSTLDNVAFGGGSKVTKNITGKIGIMQGNASDLMHGLPLQSVYRSDDEPYHESLRLTVIVYAPRSLLDQVIKEQPILKKLFGNGWVHLMSHEPETDLQYQLQRDFSWSKAF